MLTIGSICTGYGGLDQAVCAVLNAQVAWTSDISTGACKLAAHRWPDIPNLGDITTVSWHTVPTVDIICGGTPCFAAGTPVLTRRGLVAIESVVVGDEVWTNRARWRRVTASMSRMSETIEFRPGFFCTPEHLFWLRPTSKVWVQPDRRYRRSVGEARWVEAQHSAGHYAATPVSIAEVKHSKPAGIDWWQVGRYLADGYTNNQVNVYIGKGKEGDITRFPGWSKRQQETAIRLTMPKSKHVADWLNEHFGKGAAGKTIPAFVLTLPEGSRREVLDGYWSGDGYRFAKRSMRSASVSPMLTIGISMLAASLGYSISLHHNETAPTTTIQGRTVNQRDWWSVTATLDEGRYTERDSDWMWHKLRKQPKPGPVQTVYDITVEDDHSFVAAGIVVHNCQDVSLAGRRAGMTEGTRSNLWTSMREAIHVTKPAFVVWENVAGARSARAASAGDLESEPGPVGGGADGPVLRALGRVLGDLAGLGFDAEWRSVRASDVGACHRRERVFVLAWHPDRIADARGWPPLSASHEHRLARGYLDAQILDLLPTVRASSSTGPGAHGDGGADLQTVVSLLPTPSVADVRGGRKARSGARSDELLLNGLAADERFGDYAPAVARHEKAFGIPAPDPTEPGRNGTPRLSARFTEWMQGLPAGWICDVPGITRRESIELAGNGVVPQQAEAALADMLPSITEKATS